MGALTFDALLRSLKPEARAPDPVYYLHGDEDVLKDEALRALTARAVEAAARDFNVDTRSTADLDAAALRTLVDTPPLLAQTRVVVLRGIEQMRRGSKLRQELLRYLAAPNPTTMLILVQSAGEELDPELARLATAVAVAPLPPQRGVRLGARARLPRGDRESTRLNSRHAPIPHALLPLKNKKHTYDAPRERASRVSVYA